MSRVIDVHTSQVKVCRRDNILVSNGIGSCIVVAAFDPLISVGGLAHFMLSGRSTQRAANRFSFAEDAVDELIRRMVSMGSSVSRFTVCLAGGGNVLQRPDDTVCAANIASISTIMEKRRLRVAACSLGGFTRRRVVLDAGAESIMCAEGDGEDFVMWSNGRTEALA